MCLTEVVKRAGKICAGMYNDFRCLIDDFNKVIEMDNKIACLSNYNFVRAFKYTAEAICVRRATPNTETYLSLGNEAIRLLSAGREQADVLYYFDEMLRREERKC